MSLTIASRPVEDVTVLDLAGRITFKDGSNTIADEIRRLVAAGHRKILLNMAAVSYIDSSGIGQLVFGHTTVANQGGQLKLANLSARVAMLLELTRLFMALAVYDDEPAALAAFRDNSADPVPSR